MIVVDSNVLAYLYLPGEYTSVAEALFEHDPNWAAPVHFRCNLQAFIHLVRNVLQRQRCRHSFLQP